MTARIVRSWRGTSASTRSDERRTHHEQQVTRPREQGQHRGEAGAEVELERTDLVDDDHGVRGGVLWVADARRITDARWAGQDPP